MEQARGALVPEREGEPDSVPAMHGRDMPLRGPGAGSGVMLTLDPDISPGDTAMKKRLSNNKLNS